MSWLLKLLLHARSALLSLLPHWCCRMQSEGPQKLQMCLRQLE
jgi:hypothetical protein